MISDPATAEVLQRALGIVLGVAAVIATIAEAYMPRRTDRRRARARSHTHPANLDERN